MKSPWFLMVILLTVPLAAQTAGDVQTPPAIPTEQSLGIDGGTVAAEAGADAPAEATAPTGDVGVWEYLKMFALLILVIGMILAVVWFLRRISGQGPLVESPIKVLHTHALSGSRSLLLIEVGNEVLLVGSADNAVNLIKQITDQETVDALRLKASEKKVVPLQGSFASIIGTMMGQRERIRPKIDEPVENSTEFIKKQRERLKNL